MGEVECRGGGVWGRWSVGEVDTLTPPTPSLQEVEVECGEVDAYVSYADPRPGPALYDEHHRALHQRPARLYLQALQPGDTVYLRLIGQRVSQEEAIRLNCSDYNYTVGVKPNPGVCFDLFS